MPGTVLGVANLNEWFKGGLIFRQQTAFDHTIPMPNTLPCVHKALKYKSVINYRKFLPTLTLGAGAACPGCGDLARKQVASRKCCEISDGLGSKLTFFRLHKWWQLVVVRDWEHPHG